MRKIEFRAKRTKHSDPSERWIYGSYVQYRDYQDSERIAIVAHNGNYNDIRKETIGQFTGLTDKNGKEIYEGDIVRLTKIPAMDKLKFYADPFEIRYKENGCQFYGHRDGWLHDTYLYSLKEFEYEVIGNIHDNPELLGKEAAE